jgi:hypothetical protein
LDEAEFSDVTKYSLFSHPLLFKIRFSAEPEVERVFLMLSLSSCLPAGKVPLH